MGNGMHGFLTGSYQFLICTDRLLQSPYQFFRFLFITVDSSVIAVYYDVGYEQQYQGNGGHAPDKHIRVLPHGHYLGLTILQVLIYFCVHMGDKFL